MTAKLAIVIHAEEEFEWDKGFYRSKNKVSHGDELISTIEKLLEHNAKVTLAMDYAFIKSDDGIKVIKHFKHLKNNKIEFATHLHPWITPPFQHDEPVANKDSFPGNLPYDLEFEKLKTLTEEVEKLTGTRPITYLAGRYGIGKNTNDILNKLGYRVDLSISSYSNFSKIDGPDFSNFDNNKHSEGNITYLPHTCSLVAPFSFVENYFNKNPEKFEQYVCCPIRSKLLKLVRVKKYRLSPEGFKFKHLKKMTQAQIALGQEEFILSFHSPSVKVGLTPYTKDQIELEEFKTTLNSYLQWFMNLSDSSSFLPKYFNKDKIENHLSITKQIFEALD